MEATVKSMKKIICTPWNGRHLDEDKLCRTLLQYWNTPSCKDGLSPAQKLYSQPVQDMLPAHRQSFSDKWQQSAMEAKKAATHSRKKAEPFYNAHAHNFPEIRIRSNVAIQELRDQAMGHTWHYIKTQSGRVLVRNRCFLRRRVPASIPNTQNQQPAQSQSACVQRRSCRQRNLTRRLIEDPTWLY